MQLILRKRFPVRLIAKNEDQFQRMKSFLDHFCQIVNQSIEIATRERIKSSYDIFQISKKYIFDKYNYPYYATYLLAREASFHYAHVRKKILTDKSYFLRDNSYKECYFYNRFCSIDVDKDIIFITKFDKKIERLVYESTCRSVIYDFIKNKQMHLSGITFTGAGSSPDVLYFDAIINVGYKYPLGTKISKVLGFCLGHNGFVATTYGKFGDILKNDGSYDNSFFESILVRLRDTKSILTVEKYTGSYIPGIKEYKKIVEILIKRMKQNNLQYTFMYTSSIFGGCPNCNVENTFVDVGNGLHRCIMCNYENDLDIIKAINLSASYARVVDVYKVGLVKVPRSTNVTKNKNIIKKLIYNPNAPVAQRIKQLQI